MRPPFPATVLLLLFLGSPGLADETTPREIKYRYELRYELILDPDRELVPIRIVLGEGARHVRWLRFRLDPERHLEPRADGELVLEPPYVTWTPPDEGGALSLQHRLDHERGKSGFDARITDDWALFRGDDLIPPATLRQRKGAEADATLHVKLPRGWSMVAPYREIRDGVFRVEASGRSFDRPVGWMLAGRIGVRRERIDDISVAVAAPNNQDVRRMDILAFLNWNLPALHELAPGMPKRLLIVSARDDMWRGGLSGPRSLYIHSERPLISENGTSTLMHELVHVALTIDTTPKADWIVEGLAEYYSLELMRRAGTISDRRFQRALKTLAEWGREAPGLAGDNATGAVTALAVGVMHCLDQEIQERTEGKTNLDDIVDRLANSHPVSVAALREAAGNALGRPSRCLESTRLGQ